MAKINAYKFINPPKVGGAVSAEFRSVGAALNANTKAINGLGRTFEGLASTSKALNDVATGSLKNAKLKEVAERRRRQREEDRKREEAFENRKRLGPEEKVKKEKPTTKEKSWLQNLFEGLFGWLKPLAGPALAFLGGLATLKVVQDLRAYLQDPEARSRFTSFFEKLLFVFNKIKGFASWLIKDNLLEGFSKTFGKDRTVVERLQGIGQMLIGIVGLKALLNPFGLIRQVMGLMQLRSREMQNAQNRLRREQAQNAALRRQLKNQRNQRGQRPQPRGRTKPKPAPAPSGSKTKQPSASDRLAASQLDNRSRTGSKVGSGNQSGSPSSRMTPQQMLARQMQAERLQRANPGLVQSPQSRGGFFRGARTDLTRATYNPRATTRIGRLNRSFDRRLLGQAGPVDTIRNWRNKRITLKQGFGDLARSGARGVYRLPGNVARAGGAFRTGVNNRIVKPVQNAGARISSGAATLGRAAGLPVKGLASAFKFAGKLFGRVPWVGVLIQSLFEFLKFEQDEQGNLKKIDLNYENLGRGAFKVLGGALGGVIGSFIPIPIIGSMIGMQLGSYGGEMAYRLYKGENPVDIGRNILDDAKNTLDQTGKIFNVIGEFIGEMIETYVPNIKQWVGTKVQRLYESLDTFKLTDFVHDSFKFVMQPLMDIFPAIFELRIPNPFQFVDPGALLALAGRAYTALFTNKPILKGQNQQPQAELPTSEVAKETGLNERTAEVLGSTVQQDETLASQVIKNYGYREGQSFYFHHKGVKYRAERIFGGSGWRIYYDELFAYKEIDTSKGKNPWLLNAFIHAISTNAEEGRSQNSAFGPSGEFEPEIVLKRLKGFPDIELNNTTRNNIRGIIERYTTRMGGAYYRKYGDGRFLGNTETEAVGNMLKLLNYGSGAEKAFASFSAAPRAATPPAATPPQSTPPSSRDSGGGVDPNISLAGGKEKAILDLIAFVEAPGYDAVNGTTAKKPTECTIREIASYAHLQGRSGSGAAGRYQHMPPYIAGRAVNAGFDGNTLFTPGVQDKITIVMLNAPPHRMQDFLAKRMSAEAFGSVLAGTWRGFPQGPVNARRLGGTEDQTYSDSASGRNAAKKGFKWVNFVKKLKEIQGSTAPVSAPNTTPPQLTPDSQPVPDSANVAPGGSLDFVGAGDGISGNLILRDGTGKKLGSWSAVSGVYRTAGATQEQRRNVSGTLNPCPDGVYSLTGFAKHGNLSGIGTWSTFLNNSSGSIGQRSGMMLHNDIGSDGTAGCVGVELGGVAGTDAEKKFLELYESVNPSSIRVAIGKDGASVPGIVPARTQDNKPVPANGVDQGSSLTNGVLLLPPSMGGNNPLIDAARYPEIIKLLQEGTLAAYQSSGAGGIVDSLARGLGVTKDAAARIWQGLSSRFCNFGGGRGEGGSEADPSSASGNEGGTAVDPDSGYGGPTNEDPWAYARSKDPLDSPLVDTYNTLHKQWEEILGIDPDGDGFKPKELTEEGIKDNNYGYRSLSVSEGLAILGAKLTGREGTLVEDGEFKMPSYSVGGKVRPLPNSLEGFFFGKIFKGIKKAVSSVFKAVKNVVTSITNNPIFKVVSTAVSILVPPLAPIVAGINAVSSLMQGDIIGAVVGGMGALGGMFPGTFGAEGTFFAGLNKTFGDGLGGVMKGFLTGGIGGAIGGIGNMLPQGIKDMFGAMGGFMDKNPMVKNILSAGIAKIPGLGNILGPALAGAGMSPVDAIDQSAQSGGSLISSIMQAGLGMLSKAMGLEQGAMAAGINPAAFGLPPSRSAMMDPKNEAVRQMAQMGPIEVVHVPIVIEKLVAIKEPVPIIITRNIPVKQPPKA